MDDEIYSMITKYLLSIRIYPYLQGFDYLRAAIELCLKDNNYIYNVMSTLYPKLGEMFNVKPAIVERAMRFAINKAYEDGGLLGLNELYDVIVYHNDYKPANSELIAIFVEKIKIELMKKELKQKRGE